MLPFYIKLERLELIYWHLSIYIFFMGNNFYCVINCLNMNCFTISGAKCPCVVTLKDLPTSCSCYNSEEKSPKFPVPKMKLKKLMRVSLCKFFNKMFEGFRENVRLWKNFLSIYLEKFIHQFQSSTKSVSPLIA